jgi:hypothetical protein
LDRLLTESFGAKLTREEVFEISLSNEGSIWTVYGEGGKVKWLRRLREIGKTDEDRAAVRPKGKNDKIG